MRGRAPDRLLTHRSAAVGIAALRVAVGAGLLARPDLLPRVLGVDRVTAGRLRWAGQMLGGRDLGLGVGVLAAGAATHRPWLLVQAFVDAVDGVALLTAARRRAVVPLPAAALTATGLVSAAAELRLALSAPPVPGRGDRRGA
jgi:hypothetical protein